MVTKHLNKVRFHNGLPALSNISIDAEVGPEDYGSFVDPTAFISGKIALGEKDYIGPFVRINTRDAFWVKCSAEDNLQDNVTVAATTQNTIVGERTSIAHGARVVNSILGDFVFVGFNAWIENAVVEDGAMVLHGARVIGVTIPRDRIVPPGSVITCASQTQSLLPLEAANIEFKEEVISVNVELARGYQQLGLGRSALDGLSPNPRTTWNPNPIFPLLGADVDLSPDAKVIGCVQVGVGSSIGEMTSIRGDEGVPIRIGDGARIGNRVTFHGLKGQSIAIGDNLIAGDGVVFHGALAVGNRVTVGDNAILFKSTIGSFSLIGNNAIVIGVTLAENSTVPDGAVVLKQVEVDRYAPQDKSTSKD